MSMYDQLTGMDEILDDFAIEMNELIEQLDEDLLVLENGATDEIVNRVFRAFHTIKGTAGFLYFEQCQELAHVAENVLDQIRKNELDPNADIVDSLLHTIDWFRSFINHVRDRDEHDEPIKSLIVELKNYNGHSNGSVDNSVDRDVKKDTNPTKSSKETININVPEELVTEFINESREQLEFLSADLLSLEIEPDNQDLVNNLFRAFHTLTGNSGLLGLEQFSIVAHKSEDILGLVRDEKLVPERHTIDALLAAVDWMKLLIDEVENDSVSTHNIDNIMDGLEMELGDKTKKGKSITSSREKSFLKTVKSTTKKEQSKNGETVSKKRIEQTIRVDVERLDKLVNLAGELVLEKNRLLQVSRDINAKYNGDEEVGQLDSVNNSMGFITTEIQEGVMQMRMLPIATVFRKFPRLVRDLARDKGKEITLDIKGEKTELDRSVIEAIVDPMAHLLRNAVDHGVETPDVREEAGKSRQGTIGLNAYQEGNHIVITISDDGAGIDPAKITRIALEKGVINESELDIMSENDKINLIFKPGFSTAEKVTDVSGRGVGMDVVHTNIAKLNGTVQIDSTVGQGSIFTIKLPLTLAIMNGMVVQSFNEHYIIPITAISETMRYNENLVSKIRGKEVLNLRESVIPLIQLHEVFNVAKTEDVAFYIVVVQVAEKKLGIVVTGLLGQEETVVKPLGKALGKVKNMAGGTIRGDGRVSLILDIPELIKTQLG